MKKALPGGPSPVGGPRPFCKPALLRTPLFLSPGRSAEGTVRVIRPSPRQHRGRRPDRVRGTPSRCSGEELVPKAPCPAGAYCLQPETTPRIPAWSMQ